MNQQISPLQQQVNDLVVVMASVMALGMVFTMARAMVRGMLPAPTTPSFSPRVRRVRFVGVGPPPRPGRPRGERPSRPVSGRRRAMVTPEERQRMLELREEGLDYRAIADRMGRSLSVVWGKINLPYEPRYRAITPQRQQDAMLLRRMGLTLKEIGQRMRVDPTMVLYILHRAGESVDLIAEADRLNRRLLAVSEGLRPPATYDKLMDAARRVHNIAADAELIMDITPEEVKDPLRDYPHWIGHLHSRALLAEEVLGNGAWCSWASEREQLPPFPTPPQEEPGRPMLWPPPPITVTPAYRERLKACAEAALFIARGVIEGWEGYEEKAEQVVSQIEGIMAVSDAEVAEPEEEPA